MKYELGQVVYYMINNKVHSAKILARMLVENLHDDWACTPEQKKLFTPFGHSSVHYATCHALLLESEVFASKDELFESLDSE